MSLLFLAACAPAANPTPTQQVVSIYASPATQPWLSEAFACAQELQIILATSNDPAQAQISLRMGEPDNLKSAGYQIGSDDLLIVVNRESPLQNLSMEQARSLFAGSDAAIQVWVFAGKEDIQLVFSREIMAGTPTSTLARLALSPQQMLDALNAEKKIAGFLPRHWKAGTVREIFSLPDVPILAVTTSEPEGAVKEVLGCLQKKQAP